MDHDRTPWGPALTALAFVVLGLVALVRFADMPGVWIVVLLAALVAGWQGWIALGRWSESQEERE